ncbi:hypothetical protein ASZ90_008897 [hydrocarbon metagenome]|uniref:Uncharacterized protein n=1 Tax=hydrocarbon metagenome TaxID=938273 RepID=A0A0W8FKK7_9ZZZZ
MQREGYHGIPATFRSNLHNIRLSLYLPAGAAAGRLERRYAAFCIAF